MIPCCVDGSLASELKHCVECDLQDESSAFVMDDVAEKADAFDPPSEEPAVVDLPGDAPTADDDFTVDDPIADDPITEDPIADASIADDTVDSSPSSDEADELDPEPPIDSLDQDMEPEVSDVPPVQLLDAGCEDMDMVREEELSNVLLA